MIDRKRRTALTAAVLGGTLAVCLAVTATATATSAVAAGRRAAACGGYVGLTFDDGPNPGNTANLLNALTSNGLRATMFNTGQNAQNNQALVRAQRDAGMWIGNHSWSHPRLTQLGSAQMASELQRTQQVVQQATGVAPRLFRPPYGETNATLRSVAQQLGLTEVLWDVDSGTGTGRAPPRSSRRPVGCRTARSSSCTTSTPRHWPPSRRSPRTCAPATCAQG
ncbi:polysaccharide deacetylase family protein [Nonomuraea antimicrobica]